jgi:hypothetical protein
MIKNDEKDDEVSSNAFDNNNLSLKRRLKLKLSIKDLD